MPDDGDWRPWAEDPAQEWTEQAARIAELEAALRYALGMLNAGDGASYDVRPILEAALPDTEGRTWNRLREASSATTDAPLTVWPIPRGSRMHSNQEPFQRYGQTVGQQQLWVRIRELEAWRERVQRHIGTCNAMHCRMLRELPDTEGEQDG